MFRRVEIAFPVIDARLAKRLYRDLQCYLKDNSQTWVLGPDGTYARAAPRGQAFSAQQTLLETLAESAQSPV